MRIFFIFWMLLPTPSVANDGAAAIGVGGIEFKQLPGISMEKEFLEITKQKVIVRYEFRNTTKNDITTEVRCGDF